MAKSTPPPSVRSRISEAERLVDALVTEARAPLLRGLLETSQGASFRAELEMLFRHFVGDRAPREKVKVLAKILHKARGSEVEEPVIVRDISESGAQLAISARTGLNAAALATLKVRLRLEGSSEDVIVPATLARILRADEQFLHVGVKFLELPPSAALALHRLVHASGFERPSSPPPSGE